MKKLAHEATDKQNKTISEWIISLHFNRLGDFNNASEFNTGSVNVKILALAICFCKVVTGFE